MYKVNIRRFLLFILFLHTSMKLIAANSEVAHVVFEEPEKFLIHDKLLYRIVRVRVTDEFWAPVSFVPVHFSSSDRVIADFLFPATFTDSCGLAVSIIQSQVSSDTIIFPPSEFRGRMPLITAVSGGIISDEAQVNILWGAIVEPWFLGPYFEEPIKSYFKTYLDTLVSKDDTLRLQGKIIPAWENDPIPPSGFKFNTYSTDSRVAYPESTIVDSNIIKITVHCFQEGIAHIFVDGWPPAVIGVTILPATKLNEDLKSHFTPKDFNLEQNYPNPFNSKTLINYQLPNSSKVIIKIYNLTGQLVKTLVDQRQTAGYYSINWSGKDDAGRDVASGVYLYSLRAEEFMQIRKMILVR